MDKPLLGANPQQEAPPPAAAPNMPTDAVMSKDAPSAPPVPTPLSDEEVTELANELRGAQDFDARWVVLRKTMFARTIAPKQLSKVCQTFDITRRFQSARELFERGLIDDSAGDLVSTLSMGASWLSPDEAQQLLQQVQAVNTGSRFRGRFGGGFRPAPAPKPAPNPGAPSAPSAPPVPSAPPAPSAPPTDEEVQGDAVLVIRYDGKVACVIGDFSRMTANDVMVQAAGQIGGDGFTLNKHSLICAHTRHTNFHDKGQVELLSQTSKPLVDLGVKPNDRILWESRSDGQGPSQMQRGALAEIKSMFFVCDVSKDGRVSKGELRNFLWNMNLDDESLDIVWNKMNIRKNDELDIDDLLFFLGRSHLLHKEVPIDALLYDGISVMLRGRQGRSEPSRAAFERWDYDPAVDKQGMGSANAKNVTSSRETCSSIWTILSPILTLGVAAFLFYRIFVLGMPFQGSTRQNDDENNGLGIAMLAFCMIYLAAAFFCSKLGSALNNATEGFDKVFGLLDQPRYENPNFHWHIQCYHYETRTRQVASTDDKGNTTYRTETYQERVNTHFAQCDGFIPSTDHTAAFVPDTRATSCEVDTDEQHDFSNSNYMNEYVLWKNFHWRDLHADHSHTERCPSRKDSVLATWLPGTKPWWMTSGWYCAAAMCCCHFCYAVKMRSQITLQDYVYYKTCYNIPRPAWGGPWDTAWANVGTGLAVAGMMDAVATGGGYY